MSDEQKQDGPMIAVSEIGGLISILSRACGEFKELKDDLKGVIPSLQSLTEGQKRMEATISDVQKDQKEANKQHSSGIIQHDKDIIVLTNDVRACQKDAGDLQQAVKDLQKDMGGIYIKMAFVAGAVALAGWVIIQVIAAWDKIPHPRNSAIISPVPTGGRV